MTDRVKDENATREGFEKLGTIIPEILELHDLIVSTLPDIYNKTGGKLGAIGERGNQVFKKHRKPTSLVFSNYRETHKVPTGILYPLLASMRALVKYEDGKAAWRVSPKMFWEKHSKTLVKKLFERFMEDKKQNPNSFGKTAANYSELYTAARLALLDN